MTLVSLLCILALASYLALAVRLLSKRPRTTLNWTCVFVLFGLAAWSLEDIVHGFPSASPELVRLFGDIGSLGWGTFASLNLAFVLVFTHRRHLLRKWFVYLPLAALPWLIVFAQLSGRMVADYAPSVNGWRTVWSTSAWPTVFNVYYLSFTLLALGLVFRFWWKAKFLYERKQARIILATGFVAMVLGSVTDIVLPHVADPNVPELAVVFVLLWAGGIYYAVTRYGLMSVTPQAAAEDILATMRDSLLLLAPDGRVVTANQAALDLLGYQKQALVGKPAGSLFTSPGRFQETLGQATRGGELNYLELACRTSSGQEVPVSISARAMRGTGKDAAGTVWVLRDVTGRREYDAVLHRAYDELERKVRERTAELSAANQALRESEERYRRVNENVQDLIYAVDDQMRMTFVSGNCEGLLGVPADRLVGQRLDAIADMTPVSRSATEATFRRYAEAVARRQEHFEAEVELATADGGTRWVDLRARIQHDEYGRLTGSSGVLRDITERKRAEQALSEANAHLHILQQVTTTVHSTLSLEEVLKHITAGIVHSMGFTTALILLREDQSNRFAAKALTTQKGLLEPISRALGFPLSSLVLEITPNVNQCLVTLFQGKAVVTERLEEIACPIIDKATCAIVQKLGKTKRYIIVPLVTDQVIIGMICITSSREKISDDELNMVETFARVATQAIRNAKLHTQTKQTEEALRRRTEELSLLNDVDNAVNRGDDFESVVETLALRARDLFASYGATLLLLSEDGRSLVMQNLNLASGLQRAIELAIGSKIPQLVIRATDDSIYFDVLRKDRPRLINEPALIDHVVAEHAVDLKRKKLAGTIRKLVGIGSTMLVPLQTAGKPVGLLEMSRREPFTESDLERFTAIASQLSVVIGRKLDADALERHRHHLEELVQERTAELKQAQENLVRQEKLATLGQVAGSIAHEIRNPLGAIRNAAYFLKLTVSDKLTGKAAKHLEVINDEIDRCNRIITSLLDFVEGRLSEPHPCCLADILSEATARAELPRTTEVETRLPDNLPFVRVDADQMEQVFCNLITNAHQAMPDGGKVTIAAARFDGVVRVAVSDSGAGITPGNRARLFEPLFSTKAFGVGLGLAVCKGFTEANKGTISVETEVGKGTTVTVTLPAAA
jgi:PAS domain S-box-containing protein